MLTDSACSQTLAPFLHCTVYHSLIKTVRLLLDTLALLYYVLDMVPVNVVLQNHHTAKSTGFRLGLLGDHSKGGVKSVSALMQHACLIIN